MEWKIGADVEGEDSKGENWLGEDGGVSAAYFAGYFEAEGGMFILSSDLNHGRWMEANERVGGEEDIRREVYQRVDFGSHSGTLGAGL
jgi:hypothetical protein